MQISCRDVRKELANYMEDDISPELRERVERHFLKCEGCFAIYDGLRRVIRLVNSTEIIELPHGFSVCLYRKIATSSDPILKVAIKTSEIRAFAAESRRKGRS
jgi:hypothetical protein